MSMRTEVDIGPPDGDAEVHAFGDVVTRALFFLTDSEANRKEWIQREGVHSIRVARRDGCIIGGYCAQTMGMWLGGRSVPMGGIRAVGVAAEHRARGIASALMRHSLVEMRNTGLPLAALYPATQPVYRRAGYEQAGVRVRYRLPLMSVRFGDHDIAVRSADLTDRSVLEALYTRRAKRTAGNLDRGDWGWSRLLDPGVWLPRHHAYLATRNGTPEGYVVFAEKGNRFPNNELEVADLVALTPHVGRRLLTLLADHRSVASTAFLAAGPADPVLLMLEEQSFEVVGRIAWMARIVDVAMAFEARGYAPGVRGCLHLDVRDDVLPENQQRLVLTVEGGVGKVSRGGSGAFRIDVRGLAALYTGFLSPGELLATTYLQSDEPSISAATAMFAGPAPWMPDEF